MQISTNQECGCLDYGKNNKVNKRRKRERDRENGEKRKGTFAETLDLLNHY